MNYHSTPNSTCKFLILKKFTGKFLIYLLLVLMTSPIYSQSNTCEPGMVENNGDSYWSEECYLNDECEEQGNPCQANDVTMLGAYLAMPDGGPIDIFIPGVTINIALWGTFYNNTNTNRYAVRSRTEFYRNGLLDCEANACSFDVMSSGYSNALLLDGFSFQSGQLVQCKNTWVGWSTTAAQCSDPEGDDFKSECGQYPPAKCSKEYDFVEIMAPNFSYECASSTASTIEVCFTNLSVGGVAPFTYHWDFGDGNTSTEENPCHSFNAVEGEFLVLLEVTDSRGVTAAVQALVVLEELSCCQLVYTCPPGFEGIINCMAEIPAAAPEEIEILESCGIPSVIYLEEIAGNGCPADPLTLTRSYIITDDVNSDTCTQTYTVSDLVLPVIRCPSNITVECADQVPDPDPGSVIVEDNCDSLAIVTFIGDSVSNETCDNNFLITRTYHAEDACGNIATCTQMITVEDTIAPSIICLADITVTCAADVPLPDVNAVTTIDGCGGEVMVTVAADIITGELCPDNYTIARVYIATDDCGNTSTCVQTITVSDTLLPALTCPVDLTVTCATDIPPADINAVIASDNCGGGVVVTVDPDVITSMECEHQYTVLRVYTAIDLCGNMASCIQSITVQDSIPPDITCPADITVTCGENIPAANIEAVISTDNCGGPVTVSAEGYIVTDSICDNEYVLSRIYMATDACGNTSTCSQIITVKDGVLPVITCPDNITVTCEADIPEPDLSLVVVSENCDSEAEVTVSDDVITDLQCPGQYMIERVYTATDACGNSATCVQIITVSDDIAPEIECMADITVSCADNIPDADVSLITATDNCQGEVTVTVDPDVVSNEICANSYQIVRIYTATDVCGNSSTCAQTITVSDDIAPEIECIADITISCADEVPVPDVSLITTIDNCLGDVTVTVMADIVSDEVCVNGYIINRTYIATDVCGNSASCMQTITISDEINPSIICPQDIELNCIDEVPEPDVNSLIIEDNCGGTIAAIFAGDIINQGACENQVTIERTYSARDECGNLSLCVQEIIVTDDIPPVFNCPEDITVTCSSDIPTLDLTELEAMDDCEGEVIFALLDDVTVEDDCVNGYVIERTFVASDACGNSSSCVQTITVLDTIAPVINCSLTDITVECVDEIPEISPDSIESTDNCSGELIIEYIGDSIVNEVCENNFTILRTYRSTDECGNYSECVQTIVVNDEVAPVITCPADETVLCVIEIPPVDTASVSFSDNCAGDIQITHTGDVISNQSCENILTISRSYLAIDECGNSASCVQTINVMDSLAPIIAFVDPLLEDLDSGDTLFTQCFGQDPEWEMPPFSEESVITEDNCLDSVVVEYSSVLLNEGNCEEDGFIVVYRHVWTAVDICGNSDSLVAYVTLIDSIPPVIVGVPADVTVSWDSIPELPNLFARDECLCACVVLAQETLIDSTVCLDGQVITRTWSAKDACGNMTVETQRITLIDNDGPEMIITLPELTGVVDRDTMFYTCAQGGIPAYLIEMNEGSVETWDPSGHVSMVFNENLVEPVNCEFSGFLEEKSFTWSAADQCGNVSGMTITARLLDNVAPVIRNLPDMACVADPLLNDIEAVDDCGEASLRYWEDQIDNPCGDGLITMRMYEAEDKCGNITADTLLLFPDDQARPVMEFIHPDLIDHDTAEMLIINCAANNGLHAPYGAEDVFVTDACSETVSLTYTERMIEPEDCNVTGSMGIMELSWLAVDLCGNATSLTIRARLIDSTSPVFAGLEKEITIPCSSELPRITASDNCADVRVVTVDSIIQGDCIYEYDVYRTLIATDGCNNTTTEFQLVHVGDQSGPVIDGVIPVVCDDLSLPAVTAFDQCAGVFVPVAMTEDTLDELCKDVMIIERTWSATDACNHIAQVKQKIFVGDTLPPEFAVPAYSIIYDYLDLDSIPEIMMSDVDLLEKLRSLDANSVFVTDNCREEIFPEFTLEIEQMTDEEGIFERWTFTWIAIDHCGNTGTLGFIIHVIDDMPPLVELPGDTVVICAPLPPVPEMIPEDSTTTVTFTETIEDGPNPGEFLVTRTWVVTDGAGNETVTVQKIKWIPDSFIECDIVLPDSVECNSHGIIIRSDVTGGFPPYTYLWEIVGDECFIQGGQNTPEITIYVGWSDVLIRLTVTDAYGCRTVCERTLDCDASMQGFTVNQLDMSTQDGQSTILHSTAIPDDQNGTPHVWPNPTNGEVNLEFSAQTIGNMKLTVIDYTGKILVKKSIDVAPGMNHHVIQTDDLPEGVYMLQLIGENGVFTENLVILDN